MWVITVAVEPKEPMKKVGHSVKATQLGILSLAQELKSSVTVLMRQLVEDCLPGAVWQQPVSVLCACAPLALTSSPILKMIIIDKELFSTLRDSTFVGASYLCFLITFVPLI